MSKKSIPANCTCFYDKQGRHWIHGDCIHHSGKKDFTCGNCSAGLPLDSTSGETLPLQGTQSVDGLSGSHQTCSGSHTESMRWHGH